MSRWGKPSVAETPPVTSDTQQRNSEPEPSPAQPILSTEDILAARHAPIPLGMLCDQIADALDGIPVAPLAKASGVTVNTLVRAKSGEGIRLETLEKIASTLGWTITIQDREGKTVART